MSRARTFDHRVAKRLHRKGLTGKQIAAALGVSTTAVSMALRAEGVPRQRRGGARRAAPIATVHANALLREGRSVAQVASLLGVSDSGLRRAVSRTKASDRRTLERFAEHAIEVYRRVGSPNVELSLRGGSLEIFAIDLDSTAPERVP